MGLREDIGSLLTELLERAPGDVNGVAVLRPDGLMISSVLSNNADEKRVAAMAAAMIGTSQRTCDELERGDLSQVIIDGSVGKAILTNAGSKAVLAALSPAEVNLGLALLELERTAEKVKDVMNQ
ncbi:roadblock/LC7 domain-containing protein [Methanobacterium alcaliphilum]|uniref:roadblock/LC7 domain-containing protein n=1 Tax=Methanobacterium alcaliphilum TaxID=392018 RepID=UPI00200ADAEA|nr:roadblock/LC7 domain-containing protein [Methanobacterium alcaliphilum]MCK9151674.1 roadblock/LC7 domain-containing protein [Methanobacterium alcaliphilum]